MDPISHVSMGMTVVAALQGRTGSRFGPGLAAAAVAGALIPDVDCVLMPAGWDVYLRFHQVGTHSVLGASLLGGTVGFAIHRFAPFRESAASAPRLWGLVAAGTLAAWTHLLLDLLSGARLALGWPATASIFTVPLVAMAEPWLVALFVLGAIALWKARMQPRRAAIVVVLATTFFFGVKAVLYGRVVTAIAADSRFGATASRAIEARWGTLADWHVFERGPDALRAWRVNTTSGYAIPLLFWPTEPESPLVTKSRSLDTVRNFLTAHSLGFAIEQRRDEGRVEVLWSDVRYCRTDPPGSGIRCALWFGGVFDRDGRPLTQVVYLRQWLQTRPPSP